MSVSQPYTGVKGFFATIPDLSSFHNESTLRVDAPQAGLYYLIDAASTLVYIGQSSHIQRRLAEHRKEGIKKFAAAFWYPVEDPSYRLRLEGILILAANPSYNRAVTIGITAAGHCFDTTRSAFGARKSKAQAKGRRAVRPNPKTPACLAKLKESLGQRAHGFGA